MVEVFGKREILIPIMVLTAIIMFSNYYLDIPIIFDTAIILNSWVSIISAFAVGLGALFTMIHHSHKITERGDKWYLSAWLIICILGTFTLGIIFTTESAIYTWIFTNILTSLSNTTYSLIGLFIYSAAYRSFKIRNSDALLMFIAATIVLVGANTPAGAIIHPGLPDLTKWVLEFPNAGAKRGNLIAMTIFAIGYAIRVLIGRERGA